MWYRDSKKSIYVPKTEFDIQRHCSSENITAFHYLEAARQRYPQDQIIELNVSGNYIEYTRVAGNFGMDAGSKASSYSERCVLHGNNDAEFVRSHISWWDSTQDVKSNNSTMKTEDAMRISSVLETISKLLATASDEFFRSNRVAVTGWNDYVEAAKNLQPSPKVAQSYYKDLLKSGSLTVKNCIRSLSSALVELQVHRNSDESLSKAAWEAEKAMEQLIEADNEKNDSTFRGKMAVYASENLDNVSWLVRMSSKHTSQFN